MIEYETFLYNEIQQLIEAFSRQLMNIPQFPPRKTTFDFRETHNNHMYFPSPPLTRFQHHRPQTTNLQGQHKSTAFDRQDALAIKVPKALTNEIQAYLWRGQEEKRGVKRVVVRDESPFYLTVFLQDLRPFKMRDLLMLAMPQRAALLWQIIEGVWHIARKYGYFYLLEEMIGYDGQGRAKVWLHCDPISNKRQYPINHGALSEQIFAADFKDGFGGNLNQYRQFQKANNLHALQSFLQQCSRGNHGREGEAMHRQKSMGMLSSMIPAKPHTQTTPPAPLHASSFLTLKRANSLHPNELAQTNLLIEKPSYQQYQENSTLLRCNAITSPHSKLKKKPMVAFKSSQLFSKLAHKEGSQFSPATVSHTTSLRNTGQPNANPLKFSFPSTTAGTFLPFSSNGNISLNLSEQPNQRKHTQEVQELPIAEERGQSQSLQHLSQMGNTVECDLQDLFSEEKSQGSSEMQGLREQLDNVFGEQ